MAPQILIVLNYIELIVIVKQTFLNGWARDVTTEGGSGGAFAHTTITSKSPGEAVFISTAIYVLYHKLGISSWLAILLHHWECNSVPSPRLNVNESMDNHGTGLLNTVDNGTWDVSN